MADELSPSRRAVLAGAGATVVVALTGCTVYDTSGGNKPPPAPAASGGGGAPGGAGGGAATPLAKTADIPVGGGVVTSQGVVVTQPTAGQFVGFSAVCTHQGCNVSSVANGRISCPCHGSEFTVADGSVANGPANRPLGKVAVRVDGDTVFRA